MSYFSVCIFEAPSIGLYLDLRCYTNVLIIVDIIFQRIKHYVSHDSPLPMVVYGESGSGKTSLLAKAACMVHGWFPRKRPVLLVRFLGKWSR